MASVSEEWRPVAGYEGVYSVSNLGRVRRDKRTTSRAGHILKSSGNRNGYQHVSLCVWGIPKTINVHNLVAEAFHGRRPKGRVIHHINGNRTDNRSSNLRYQTQSENVFDAVKRGTHFTPRKLSRQEYETLRTRYERGEANQYELADEYGVSQSAISRWLSRNA